MSVVALTLYPSFVEGKNEGKHNLQTDQIMVAFTNAAPNPAHTVLADLSPINHANMSSRVLSMVSSSMSGGTYRFIVADNTITSSGGSSGPYQHIHIYNNTATNKDLIAYGSFAAAKTLEDTDQQVLDFDGTEGLLKDVIV